MISIWSHDMYMTVICTEILFTLKQTFFVKKNVYLIKTEIRI